MQAVLKKLHYRDHHPVLVLNAPAEAKTLVKAFGETLTAPKGKSAFVLAFVQDEAAVGKIAKVASKALDTDGVFWLAYPKSSSKKYRSTLKRDGLHALMHKCGFDGVSLVSLDEDWSAMRFKVL